MLIHIHQPQPATLIHNALLKVLEEGIHTNDIFREGVSKERVGTREFAQASFKDLAKKPASLKAVDYKPRHKEEWSHHGTKVISNPSRIDRYDIYLYSHDPLEKIVQALQEANTPPSSCQWSRIEVSKYGPKDIQILCVLINGADASKALHH